MLYYLKYGISKHNLPKINNNTIPLCFFSDARLLINRPIYKQFRLDLTKKKSYIYIYIHLFSKRMKLKPKFRNNLNFKKQCHFSADRAFKIVSLLTFAREIVKSPQPKNPNGDFYIHSSSSLQNHVSS